MCKFIYAYTYTRFLSSFLKKKKNTFPGLRNGCQKFKGEKKGLFKLCFLLCVCLMVKVIEAYLIHSVHTTGCHPFNKLAS